MKTKSVLSLVAALVTVSVSAACSGGGDAPAAGKVGTAGTSATRVPSRDDSTARLATAEFAVRGMTCGGCALATEMAVKKLGGVESADAEYLGEEDGGRCTVTYDPDRVTADEIAAAIREAGFGPTLTASTSGS